MLPKTSYGFTQVDLPNYFMNKSGEKQAKPYNLMCKLWNATIWNYDINSRGGRTPEAVNNLVSIGMQYIPSGMQTRVNNLSYKRMADKLGDASSLGATLTAERRETWGMIVGTVARALSAARNIRKLNFAAAARDLGLPYHERTVVKRFRVGIHGKPGRYRYVKVRRKEFRYRGSRYYAKTLGSGWLMYSYGVKPLASDIYNGMDVLQREFPWKRIFGYATETGVVVNKPYPSQNDSYKTTLSVRQSVDVRVKNPNLWLMNRLGLVNPLQWAVEGIPLSFIVDWFSNLSEVVNSLTDFVGLETSNPCVNRLAVQEASFIRSYSVNDWINWKRTWRDRRRELTLTPPKFRVAYERFQWQRGANAISLLLQVLKY